MEQLTPAASGLVQFVFALLNELAPLPVSVVGENVIAAELLFFSVITWVAALDPTAVEANVMEDGVTLKPALALAPVPVNVTVCAEDEAESK